MITKIEYKEGVSGTAKAPLDAALKIVSVVYGWFGQSTLIVTSLRDGKHMLHSLHERGYAADFRTFTVDPSQQQALLAAIKGQLGASYDVVLEADHLHVEFDPEHNGGKNLPD
jgi:hypothetical protein